MHGFSDYPALPTGSDGTGAGSEAARAARGRARLFEQCNVTTEVRATDQDRADVVIRINGAYARGAISPDEHDARVEAVLRSVTRDSLSRLVTDLPAPRHPLVQPARAPWAPGVSLMLFSILQFIFVMFLSGVGDANAGTLADLGGAVSGVLGLFGLISGISWAIGATDD